MMRVAMLLTSVLMCQNLHQGHANPDRSTYVSYNKASCGACCLVILLISAIFLSKRNNHNIDKGIKVPNADHRSSVHTAHDSHAYCNGGFSFHANGDTAHDTTLPSFSSTYTASPFVGHTTYATTSNSTTSASTSPTTTITEYRPRNINSAPLDKDDAEWSIGDSITPLTYMFFTCGLYIPSREFIRSTRPQDHTSNTDATPTRLTTVIDQSHDTNQAHIYSPNSNTRPAIDITDDNPDRVYEIPR